MSKPEPELRQKYLDALERLESSEAHSRKQESVLRLLIGRLCLAARGQSARLDGELRALGEILRRDPAPEDIEACLEPLSRAVAALDQLPDREPARETEPASAKGSDASSVEASIPSSARAPEPSSGKAPDPKRSGKASQPSEASLAPARAAESAAPSHAAPPEREAHPDSENGSRDERVDARIVAMLERVAALPELEPALAELNDHPIASLSPAELAAGLERVARLIGEQRSRLRREKLEVEDLLRQIDARLEEVGTYLAGEAAEQKDAQENTQQLNLLVLDEMHELNTDVQRAIDLAQLRIRVRERLESITTHLQSFRSREEQRYISQVERTGHLRVRIAELEQESRSLQRSLQEEQRLALIDSLTGIANRAAYDERIRHELTYSQQGGGPVSILAWDIDRFKAVNDAYGHRAGDKVLRVIGQHLAQHVRGTDFVARYGGEEFMMILVGTHSPEALIAAEKIREGIARIGFHFRSRPVTVTASCGITTVRADDTPDSVFDRADQALYRAKNGGRNRCIIL